jgi:hypothetical protein
MGNFQKLNNCINYLEGENEHFVVYRQEALQHPSRYDLPQLRSGAT